MKWWYAIVASYGVPYSAICAAAGWAVSRNCYRRWRRGAATPPARETGGAQPDLGHALPAGDGCTIEWYYPLVEACA